MRLFRHIATHCLLFSLLFLSSSALGQSTWEVTPYRVRLWWSVGDSPDFPQSWKSQLASSISQQLTSQFVGVCEIQVEPVPESVRLPMRRNMAELTREQLFAADVELSKFDKLFLLSIDSDREEYKIQVRELDCLVTHIGPVDQQSTFELSDVLPRSVQLLTDAFSPVVRIDRAADRVAKTRLRAAALIQGSDSPGTLAGGEVLLPYDRKVKSTGEFNIKNVRPVDWTYLLSTSAIAGTGVADLEIVTGVRQPFRSKRSRRLQQYAIRARALTETSTIRILSRVDEKPLSGLEIHEKGDSVTSFLGYTDWKGELLIPRSNRKVRELLVRSGTRVTAKMPIVPGLLPEITARIRDNRTRVQADGFLSGVQISIIDLVAKRESLTTRIRNRISEKNFDEAEKLLNQFRNLPTQAEFRTDVEQQLRLLKLGETTADRKLRTQITTTFVQTISTLGTYLDEGRTRQLETELTAARGS